MSADEALARRVEELATDVGRLRRVVPTDSRTWFLVERITEHARWLDVLTMPAAAELVSFGIAVERALTLVDDREALIRKRLGLKEGEA